VSTHYGRMIIGRTGRYFVANRRTTPRKLGFDPDRKQVPRNGWPTAADPISDREEANLYKRPAEKYVVVDVT